MLDEVTYFRHRLEAAPPVRWGRFVAFKVTFKLGSPVCVTTPWISFDGLLAHLLLLDALGEDFFITPKKLDLSSYFPHNRRLLPLKRTGPVYHASVSQFVPNVPVRKDTIYKRFEERWTDGLRQTRIRQGSGHFRAYAMAQPYVPAREVVFYAFGDVELIRRLVENYIYGIGNDFRIGYGAVRDVRFERMEEDWSLVASGVAMRPLPVEMCAEYDDTAYLPYRAPYWSPKNVALCVPPGARCRLKDGLESRAEGVGPNAGA